jgi:hypothetical protein
MAVVSIAAGCALAVPATSFVNSVIFGAKSAMSERSLMIFDVAGISAREKIDLFGELPDWPTAMGMLHAGSVGPVWMGSVQGIFRGG